MKLLVKSGTLELDPLVSTDMHCLRLLSYRRTSPARKGGMVGITAVLIF